LVCALFSFAISVAPIVEFNSRISLLNCQLLLLFTPRDHRMILGFSFANCTLNTQLVGLVLLLMRSLDVLHLLQHFAADLVSVYVPLKLLSKFNYKIVVQLRL